jgi:hypothetical protein
LPPHAAVVMDLSPPCFSPAPRAQPRQLTVPVLPHQPQNFGCPILSPPDRAMGGEEIHFASRPLLLPVLTLTHPKTHVISTGGGALAVASYASSKVYSGIVTQYNFFIPVSGGKQSRKARRTQQQAAQRLEKALQEVRMEDNEKQTAADATSASQGKKAPIGWIKRFTFWFSNPANSNWIIAVFTALLCSGRQYLSTAP